MHLILMNGRELIRIRIDFGNRKAMEKHSPWLFLQFFYFN